MQMDTTQVGERGSPLRMMTDWEFPGTVVASSAATFQKRDLSFH